jgi:hypothetical protein
VVFLSKVFDGRFLAMFSHFFASLAFVKLIALLFSFLPKSQSKKVQKCAGNIVSCDGICEVDCFGIFENYFAALLLDFWVSLELLNSFIHLPSIQFLAA